MDRLKQARGHVGHLCSLMDAAPIQESPTHHQPAALGVDDVMAFSFNALS